MLTQKRLFTYLLLLSAASLAVQQVGVGAAVVEDKKLKLVIDHGPALKSNAKDAEKEARKSKITKFNALFADADDIDTDPDGTGALWLEEDFFNERKKEAGLEATDFKDLKVWELKKILNYAFYQQGLKLQCDTVFKGMSSKADDDNRTPFKYMKLQTDTEAGVKAENEVKISVSTYWFTTKTWIIIGIGTVILNVAGYFLWQIREDIQREFFPNTIRKE